MKYMKLVLFLLSIHVSALAQSSGCTLINDVLYAGTGYEIVRVDQSTLYCKQIGGGTTSSASCVCGGTPSACAWDINPDNPSEAKCSGSCMTGIHSSGKCHGVIHN